MNNSAAGSQPGPLPKVGRVVPVNVPGGTPRFIPSRPAPPDHIIYHSTVTSSRRGNSTAWLSTNPISGVSIHSLANRDGTLTEICPPSYTAFHAGYTLPGWQNPHSLGIEIENSSNNGDRVEEYYPAQVNAAAWRVAGWCFSYGITDDRLKAHRDVAVYGPDSPRAGHLGRKSDPCGPFDDQHFRALVWAWVLFFRSVPPNEIGLYIY